MTIITISAVGIGAVLLAVSLKGIKSEYGIYVAMAAELFLVFYGVGKLESVLRGMEEIQNFIQIDPVYLTALLKMVGITYVAEFASGICRDGGYGALANQIEIFAKLTILGISMPVLLALFRTLEKFLQ